MLTFDGWFVVAGVYLLEIISTNVLLFSRSLQDVHRAVPGNQQILSNM